MFYDYSRPYVSILAPDLTLIGDLKAETWPRYLEKHWLILVIEAIRHCDFRVERHPYGVVSDATIRFLVGESGHSRRLAIHPADHPGIIYILEDDGEGWTGKAGPFDLKPIKPVKVITLGELIKDGYSGVHRHLELKHHKNSRLIFDYERDPTQTSIEA